MAARFGFGLLRLISAFTMVWKQAPAVSGSFDITGAFP